MKEIEVRAATTADLDFVYATWLRSYRHASQFAKKISNTTYYTWHHRVVERILSREGAKLLIAHPKEDPELILGYICTEKQPDGMEVVHYCYVKKTFRQLGVAKALISGASLGKMNFTHWTTDTDWALKKYPGMSYNPYRI